MNPGWRWSAPGQSYERARLESRWEGRGGAILPATFRARLEYFLDVLLGDGRTIFRFGARGGSFFVGLHRGGVLEDFSSATGLEASNQT